MAANAQIIGLDGKPLISKHSRRRGASHNGTVANCECDGLQDADFTCEDEGLICTNVRNSAIVFQGVVRQKICISRPSE